MNYDVCIVGAGIAGAVAGYQLALDGHKVILLDAGPRFKFLSEERYGRVKRGEEPWLWEVEDRDLYEETSTPNIGLNDNRIKAVGGSTLKWNARAERLMPKDFNMESLFGLSVDWPIDYSDLESWYYKAEQELGVAGKDSPDAPPRSNAFPLPHHPISFAEKEFFVPAFKNLGLTLGYDSLAINSKEYDGRPKCDLYATCIPMCPTHAKYTAMAHVLKGESTGNVTVKPNCHVNRVKLSSKRKVKSVQYIDHEGKIKEQTASVFILATGGVEIPRLLLLSSDNEFYPNGLANSSNQVGRNYMTHPWIRVRGNLPDKIGSHRIGFGTTCSWSLYQHEKMSEIGNVLLMPNTKIGPEPATIAANSKLWGEDLINKIQEEYGHMVGINIMSEMLPDQENRLTLSKYLVDCYGDPAPSIKMSISDFEKKSLSNGKKMSIKILEEMQAKIINDDGIGAVTNHIIGTTRMGRSANDNVCDGWAKCHDLDNLYIAGSSLFPSSGCAAPTLTIVALALRTADYISKSL